MILSDKNRDDKVPIRTLRELRAYVSIHGSDLDAHYIGESLEVITDEILRCSGIIGNVSASMQAQADALRRLAEPVSLVMMVDEI